MTTIARSPSRRPQFTEKEWDAVRDALAFIEAGEDPWADEATGSGPSPTLRALLRALTKLRQLPSDA